MNEQMMQISQAIARQRTQDVEEWLQGCARRFYRPSMFARFEKNPTDPVVLAYVQREFILCRGLYGYRFCRRAVDGDDLCVLSQFDPPEVQFVYDENCLTSPEESSRVWGMTKDQEIEALKKFAASLPKDSYLYAAISYLVPQFEGDIRSDIISLVEVRGIARDTVEVRQQFKDIHKLVEQKKQELQLIQDRADFLNRTIKETKATLAGLAREISRIL